MSETLSLAHDLGHTPFGHAGEEALNYCMKDYGGFTRDLSSQMLYGANEVELGKQWSTNKLLSSLSEGCKAIGCLRRGKYVTIVYRQTSTEVSGDFLGRLVLGDEGDEVKVFGATIF